jgi:hypothetical protein
MPPARFTHGSRSGAALDRLQGTTSSVYAGSRSAVVARASFSKRRLPKISKNTIRLFAEARLRANINHNQQIHVNREILPCQFFVPIKRAARWTRATPMNSST